MKFLLKQKLLVILLLASIVICGSPIFCYWPTDDWRTSTPEEQGIDSAGLSDIYSYIKTKKLNTHSMVIIRNGYIISEGYGYPYQKDTMINIHSCTKSIISALVGIAIRDGFIQSVHQNVLDFFPGVKMKNLSAWKKEMTIADLLTMSSGIQAKYPDTGDDMQETKDWAQYVLDLKMAAKPGTVFNYSDCDAHLVSAIIQRATGMSADAYAESRLFKPLGIKAYWPKDPQGRADGWGNINMTPRDMAKFGFLILNKGQWDGKQLIPAEWIAESTRKQIRSYWTDHYEDDYGYFWWLDSDGGVSARGSGGQFIHLARELNIVIVNTNGFNQSDELNTGQFGYCIKSSGSIPANPEGLAKLRSLENSLQYWNVERIKEMPTIAAKISGKVIDFGNKNDGYRKVVLDFGKAGEAILRITSRSGDTLEYRLCTDGGYFTDESRRYYRDTIFLKGYWADERTFAAVCEKGERLVLYLTFNGEEVTLKMTDRGVVKVENLIGKLQK